MQKLQVPENIPLRWELWRGFGKPELLKSAGITAIVTAGCVTFCLLSHWPPREIAAVMIVIFTLFFCAGFFSKMDNNQSIFDYLMRGRRYHSRQQRFLYKREKEGIAYEEKENVR